MTTMKWTLEAENAVKKVPFFVRKRVRRRVEEEAREAGRRVVDLEQVKTARRRFLDSMASEIKGYQLDVCFGPGGCPNRAFSAEGLMPKLERVLNEADLLGFLKDQVGEHLKFHHEMRISVAECPNACSQPQIKDVGIIAVCRPRITAEPCSECGCCVAVCPDRAVTFDADQKAPAIDRERCLDCGRCAAECPTATIRADRYGYRALLGGKLGRHPRLARALPGIFDEHEVVEIVEYCIAFYKQRSRAGRRFAQIFEDADFADFRNRFSKKKIR